MSIWNINAFAVAAAFAFTLVAADASAQSAQPSSAGEVQVASQTGEPVPAEDSKAEEKAVSEPSDDPNDPLQIVVSLPEQKLTVYRGLTVVTTSNVSTGQNGYNTPSGVFTILLKKRYHRSNIYSGAPMPFMQRLTWSGIALHASNSVPPRPASHGCIRLPNAFAPQLFGITEPGVHVIVANEAIAPKYIAHDRLFQPVPHDATRVAVAARPADDSTDATPGEEMKRSTAPVRILVTRMTGREQLKDIQQLLFDLQFDPGDIDGYMGPDTAKAITRFQKTYRLPANGLVSPELIAKLYAKAGKGAPANGRLYVRQDFNPVFEAPVVISDGDDPLGSHLFTAMHFGDDATQARWITVTLTKGSPTNRYNRWSGRVSKAPDADKAEAVVHSTAEEALNRIAIPDDVRNRINTMLTPGSSLAITNDGISYETMPKGTDFVVLMQ